MTTRLLITLCGLCLAACSPQQTPAPTSLIEAAEQGDARQVQRWLSIDPGVDVRDACQWTPLMKAALHGHLQVLQQLLEAGVQPDLGDKGEYTALMLAASNNHAKAVRLLIAHGADINHRENTQGWSALIWAAKQGHMDTVKVLIEAGAETRFLDRNQRSAQTWAELEQHAEVAAYLAAHPST